jgi:hypothetical protein
LSTTSAICADITTWAALNIVAANFEKAFTMREVARSENSIHPDNDELLAAFGKAKELVGSYSPACRRAAMAHRLIIERAVPAPNISISVWRNVAVLTGF